MMNQKTLNTEGFFLDKFCQCNYDGCMISNFYMPLTFKTLQSTYSHSEFISFWKVRYRYESEINYSELLKSEVTEKNLKELFVWKNGMKLSPKKEESFKQKILPRIETIEKYKIQRELPIKVLYEEFDQVSLVWRVFLCHVVRPDEFPIYDQHIHRAVLFIQGNENWKKVTNTLTKNQKEKFYFDNYLKTFLPQLEEFSLRDIDQALFAFGRYLKEYELPSQF